MNWKEQFDKEFEDEYFSNDLHEAFMTFIETEVIERLIDGIEIDYEAHLKGECRFGTAICSAVEHEVKQQLRAKWLAKEQQ